MASKLRHVAVLVNSRYEDSPYDRWAKDSDLALTLLVAEDRAEGYAHMSAPHRVFAFDNYAHNGNVERMVLALHAEQPFVAIVAKSEPDILRAARLRGLLRLPGQDWRSAIAFRDKIEMKRRLAAAGVAAPEFARLSCGADLCAFVAAKGYPVVVKPVLGSGSLDTQVLLGPADLERRLAVGVDARFEVEVFIPGKMYIVDAFVLEGRVRFSVASRYVNDCLSFQRGEFLGVVLEDPASPLCARLLAFADKALAALPLPETTTVHMEIWRTPDDELVFCEAASRTGGIRINEAIMLAHGFDMDRSWFSAQLGLPVVVPEAPLVKPVQRGVGHMAVYYGDGVLDALPTTPPPDGIISQTLLARIGDVHHGSQKSGMYLAAFVVTGQSDLQVEQRFTEVARWFHEGCRYARLGAAS
jgi:hypothetical protein